MDIPLWLLAGLFICLVILALPLLAIIPHNTPDVSDFGEAEHDASADTLTEGT